MRLGIDFGTTHTVAMLQRHGDRVEPLLFRSSPLLPSAVYAADDGLIAGHDAVYSARVEPGRYEAHPKRRIDDGTLLLGPAEVPVKQAVAAVLSLVAAEARRVGGAVPDEVVITHPAGWGGRRRAVLVDAAESAGFGAVTSLPEPVSAAAYFTSVLGHTVAPGQSLVVYDLGGGTFDISVVRRGPDGGWEITASAGLDDVGGVDLDAAIVAWLRAHAPDEAAWTRLTSPGNTADRRHRRQLWEDARAAKEQLTTAGHVAVAVPLLERDVLLTRDEFEQLARPWIERTVTLTTATLFTSGVTAAGLAGVFLVGGGSRVPMVGTMLHRALNVAPVALDQPELVVARGSLCALTAPAEVPTPEVPTPVEPAPVVPPTAPESPAPAAVAAAPAAPADAAGLSALRPLLALAGIGWALLVAFVLLQAGGAFDEASIRYDTQQLVEYVYAGARAPVGPAAFVALLAVPLLVASTGGSVRRVVGGSALAGAVATVVLVLCAVGMGTSKSYPSDGCSIFETEDSWHHYFDSYGLQQGGGGRLGWSIAAGAALVAIGLVLVARGRVGGRWYGWAAVGLLAGLCSQSYLNDLVLTCGHVVGWRPRWDAGEFTPVAMFAEGFFALSDRGIGWKSLYVVAFLVGITVVLAAAALGGLLLHRLLAGRGGAWPVRVLAVVLVAGGAHATVHAYLERRAWDVDNEPWRIPDAYLSGTHTVWQAAVDWIGPVGFTVCALVAFHVLLIAAAAWRRTATPGR